MLFWKKSQPQQPSAENKTENASRPFGLIEQLRIDELLENGSFPSSKVEDIAQNENDLGLLKAYFIHLKETNLRNIECQTGLVKDIDFRIEGLVGNDLFDHIERLYNICNEFSIRTSGQSLEEAFPNPKEFVPKKEK
jgi:hypothetical protein